MLFGRLPTFSVVAETHLRLAEANGVFTLGDAIELFQLGLVHALGRKIKLQGLDADVLRSRHSV